MRRNDTLRIHSIINKVRIYGLNMACNVVYNTAYNTSYNTACNTVRLCGYNMLWRRVLQNSWEMQLYKTEVTWSTWRYKAHEHTLYIEPKRPENELKNNEFDPRSFRINGRKFIYISRSSEVKKDKIKVLNTI